MPDNLIRVIFLLGARNGNFRLSDMTEHLGISRATLSKSLSLLRSRGLIAGEAAPGYRRSVHVSLTPSGKEAYERLLHAGLSRVTSAAHGHSEEGLKIINRFLTELISLLDDEPQLMLPLQAN